MDYQYNSDEENYISTKKLFLILGLSVFGVFIVLSFFVFPINNLFRETVSEEAIIISKSENICVVETMDHPRQINNCVYEPGDLVQVTFDEGTQSIKKHQLVNN